MYKKHLDKLSIHSLRQLVCDDKNKQLGSLRQFLADRPACYESVHQADTATEDSLRVHLIEVL